MSKTLLADGKTPCERRFGGPFFFQGPAIAFGAVVETCPISARDQSRLHQFGKKVFPGIFLGVFISGGVWKGDTLVAEVGKDGRIGNPSSDSENPLSRREQPVGSEDLSGELQGESEGSQPTESKDDGEAQRDFWSKVISSIVITMNLEFNSMRRRKKHSPFH